jgi:hypothetical protein
MALELDQHERLIFAGGPVRRGVLRGAGLGIRIIEDR